MAYEILEPEEPTPGGYEILEPEPSEASRSAGYDVIEPESPEPQPVQTNQTTAAGRRSRMMSSSGAMGIAGQAQDFAQSEYMEPEQVAGRINDKTEYTIERSANAAEPSRTTRDADIFGKAKEIARLPKDKRDDVVSRFPVQDQSPVRSAVATIETSSPGLASAVGAASTALKGFGNIAKYDPDNPEDVDLAERGFEAEKKRLNRKPLTKEDLEAHAYYQHIKDQYHKRESKLDKALRKADETLAGKASESAKHLSNVAQILNAPELREYNVKERIEALKKTDSKTAAALESGDLGFVIDQMVADAALTDDPEAAKRALKLKNDFQKVAGKKTAAKGVVQNLYLRTLEMLPPMVKTGVKSAIPVVGQVWSMSEWARQGMGDVYGSMVESGVSHETARNISPFTGILYAAVERIQLGQLANIPKATVDDSIKRAILRLAREKGEDYLKEVSEEGMQRLVTDVGAELGKRVDGVSTDDMEGLIKKFGAGVLEEMRGAAGPMGVLSAFGLGAGSARAAMSTSRQKGAEIDSQEERELLGREQQGQEPGRPVQQPEQGAGTPVSGGALQVDGQGEKEPGAVPEQSRRPLSSFGIEDPAEFYTRPQEEQETIFPQLTEAEQDRVVKAYEPAPEEISSVDQENAGPENDIDEEGTAQSEVQSKFPDPTAQPEQAKVSESVDTPGFEILEPETGADQTPQKEDTIKPKTDEEVFGVESIGAEHLPDGDAAADSRSLPKVEAKTEAQAEEGGDQSSLVPSQSKRVTVDIEGKKQEVESNPSEAQKEAGNYKMGHVKREGLDISIENPAGSIRSGVDRSGKPWMTKMHHHYGYIRGTKGRDKDHLDVFIKPDSPTDGDVYVVNQVDPQTGKFDEHKIMMGFKDEGEARKGYLANYTKDWKGMGDIVQMGQDDFRRWIRDFDTTKPAKKMPRTFPQGFTGILEGVSMGGAPLFSKDFRDSSFEERGRNIKRERQAIKKALKDAAAGKIFIDDKELGRLQTLHNRLSRVQRKYSQNRISRTEANQWSSNRYSELGYPETDQGKQMHEDVVSVLENANDANILTAFLPDSSPEELSAAKAAIKDQVAGNSAAKKLRKDISDLLVSGVTPDQVVEITNYEAQRQVGWTPDRDDGVQEFFQRTIEKPESYTVPGWPGTFYDAPMLSSFPILKKDPDWQSAKKGADLEAGMRLASRIVKEDRAKAIVTAFAPDIIVGVQAEESHGKNKIPVSVAGRIGILTGTRVDTEIYQATKSEHTGKDTQGRLEDKPSFAGTVEKGKRYLLVDDVITSGGTLNELRKYIEANGGVVSGVTACAAARPRNGARPTRLKPTRETLEKLEKSGAKEQIKSYITRYGYEKIESLTDTQIRSLLTQSALKRIRAEVPPSGQAGFSGPHAQKVEQGRRSSEPERAVTPPLPVDEELTKPYGLSDAIREMTSGMSHLDNPRDVANAYGELLRARAEAVGMSADQYVNKRLRFESENAINSQDLRQGGAARGKITLRKGAPALISLLKDADASTIGHELGHLFMDDLAIAGGKDWKVVADWLNIDKPADLSVDHQEQFARTFERWLREGKAPSKKLQTIFEQFREWLRQVYETIKRYFKDSDELTPEIRGVFERLLSGEGDKKSEGSKGGAGRDLKQSPVDVTKTEAFKNWFGDWENDPDNASKIVDGNGAPLRLYHETAAKNTSGIKSEGFDLSIVGSRNNDSEMPDGIFMKQTGNTIGVGGEENSVQIPLYANIRNPLRVGARDQLVWLYTQKDSEYDNLHAEADAYDKKMNAKFEAVWNRDADEDIGPELDRIMETWEAGINKRSAKARARLTQLLKADGYDGLIVEHDAGSLNRKVKTIVALSPNQVKSAIGNRGTFDPDSPVILEQSPKDENLYDDEGAFARIVNSETMPSRELPKKVDRTPQTAQDQKVGRPEAVQKQLEEIAKHEKEINRLRGRHLSLMNKDEAEMRARIQMELKDLQRDKMDQVRQMVYDYSRKLGLHKIPNSRIDTLLKNTRSVASLKKAMDLMDSIVEKRHKETLRQKVMNRVVKEKYYIERAKRRRHASIASDHLERLEEYLNSITDISEQKQEKLQRSLNYFLSRGATTDIATKLSTGQDVNEKLKEWFDDPSSPVPESLHEMILDLFKGNIKSMTTQELHEVLNDIDTIKKHGKLKRDLEEEQRKRRISSVADAAVKEIEAAHKVKNESPIKRAVSYDNAETIGDKAKEFSSWIRNGVLDTERIIKWLVGGKRNSILERELFKPLWDSSIDKLRNTKSWRNRFKHTYKDIDIAEARSKTFKTFVVEQHNKAGAVVSKEELPLTLENMMFVYANSRNSGNRAHLRGTGLTDTVIEKIIEDLPAKYKSMVDEQMRYYDQVQWSRINEVFKKVYGVAMPKEHDYFPIMSLDTDKAENAVLVDLLARHGSRMASVSKGFSMGRVNSAAPFKHMSYFNTVLQNAMQVEQFVSFQGSVRDANALLNNPNLSKVLKNVDERAYAKLKDWLNSMAYGRIGASEHDFEKFFQNARRGYAIYVLAYKATSVLMQAGSLAKGLSMVSPARWSTSIGRMIKNPKSFMEYIDEKSPFMESRMQDFEREVSEMAERNATRMVTGTSATGKEDGLRKVSTKVKDGLAKTFEAGMWPLAAFDKVIAASLWDARYREVLNKTENEKAAIDAADEMVRKTQSGGGLITLPAWYRGSGLVRMFSMFKSDPSKTINMMYEIGMELKAGEIKAGDAARMLGWIGVMAPMISFIMENGGKMPWDEPEEFGKEMVSNFSDGITFFGGVLQAVAGFGLDKINEARGGDPDRTWINWLSDPSFPPMQPVLALTEGLAKGDASDLFDAFAMFAGVPWSMIKRVKRGHKDVVKTGDLRYYIWHKGALEDNSVTGAMRKRLMGRGGWEDRLKFVQWFDDLHQEKRKGFLLNTAKEEKVSPNVVIQKLDDLRQKLNKQDVAFSDKRNNVQLEYSRGEIDRAEFERKMKRIDEEAARYRKKMFGR